MIDEYTRLLEVAAGSEDERIRDKAVDKLILHLKSMGRAKMLTEIAKELRKIAARREVLAPLVEVASEKGATKALKIATKLGIKAKKAHVNPTLIEGFRARGNGLLMDRSAKRVLVDIYQQSTT